MSKTHKTSLLVLKEQSLMIPTFRYTDTATPEELKEAIDSYLQDIFEKQRVPTMTGLAKFLGLSRLDFLNACTVNPSFNIILETAKATIIEYVEELLLTGRSPIGLIFWLKNNADWIDKTEVDHNNKSIADILKDLERQGNLIQGEIKQ